MNSKNYVDFLQANFMQWFNNKSKTFKNKLIFMYDNIPSHAARVISQFLQRKGFKEERFRGLAGSFPRPKLHREPLGLAEAAALCQ